MDSEDNNDGTRDGGVLIEHGQILNRPHEAAPPNPFQNDPNSSSPTRADIRPDLSSHSMESWRKSIPPPPDFSPPSPPKHPSLIDETIIMSSQDAGNGYNPTNPFGSSPSPPRQSSEPTTTIQVPSLLAPKVLPPRHPAGPTIAAIPPSNKKKKKKKKKGKKQSKTGNKTKESNTATTNMDASTAASYASTYRQQYNAMQKSNESGPAILNYHEDEEEEDLFCNAPILQRLFGSSRRKKKYNPISNDTTINYGDNEWTYSTSSRQEPFAKRNKEPLSSPPSSTSVTTSSFFPSTPNTGVLNSSDGEGTTIPQLLVRMRILNIIHVLLTLSLEGWALLGNVITLNFARVILGIYFIFFVVLLGIFELLRGRPISMTTVSEDDDGTNGSASTQTNGGMSSFANIPAQQAQLMGSVLWKMVVDGEQTRSVRRFMQDNFGILYSCKGRGVYICLVGGIAVGQGWLIALLGFSFICLGLWTISLGIRYPALDKAFTSNLDTEEEFWRTAGGGDTAFSYGTNSVTNGVSAGTGNFGEDDKSTSNVTWSSVGLSYSTGIRSMDSSVLVNEKKGLLS